jgi:hypothetical protein
MSSIPDSVAAATQRPSYTAAAAIQKRRRGAAAQRVVTASTRRYDCTMMASIQLSCSKHPGARMGKRVNWWLVGGNRIDSLLLATWRRRERAATTQGWRDVAGAGERSGEARDDVGKEEMKAMGDGE